MKRTLKAFFKLRKFLIYSKLWIQRTMSWIAIINSGMILFLVLAKLQDYGVKIYISAWFIPIYIGIIFLMILFGYLEDRAGFYREEAKAAAKRNPYFEEIVKRLDKIEKKLKNK